MTLAVPAETARQKLSELCEKAGFDARTIRQDLKLGWYVRDAGGNEVRLGKLYESAVQFLLRHIELHTFSKDFKLPDIEFSEDQKSALAEIIEAVKENKGRYILRGYAGTGKCHGKGTKILRHDGRIVNVEDVVVGDTLMGPDGLPRTVMSTTTGRGLMFRISGQNPYQYEPFVCNDAHILPLVYMGTTETHHRHIKPGKKGQLIELTVEQFLTLRPNARNRLLSLRKAEVSFAPRPVETDPFIAGIIYYRGVLSGENITVPVGEKDGPLHAFLLQEFPLAIRIPEMTVLPSRATPSFKDVIEGDATKYIVNCREVQAAFFAGFLYAAGKKISRISTSLTVKNSRMLEDFKFLARSLGVAITYTEEKKDSEGFIVKVEFDGLRLTITPDEKAPRELPRRAGIYTRAGVLKVEHLGMGDYYGFTLQEPDGLYLLHDFTVTHNTTLMQYLPQELEKNTGQKPRLAFCAPTHQAVRVLRKKIPGAICTTIHSFLGLRLKYRQGKAILEQVKYPALDQFDAVIVDEASMLTKELVEYLLAAQRLAWKTSIIIVGDPKQLNPVNEGISLSFSLENAKSFELKKILRQGELNPVLFNSRKVRRMTTFMPGNLKFFSNEQGKFEKVSALDWTPLVKEMFKSDNFAKDNDYVRYLAWTNAKVDMMNGLIHDSLYGKTDTPWVEGEMVRAQKPIGEIIRTNEECIVEGIVPHEDQGFRCWKVTLASSLGLQVEGLVLHESETSRFKSMMNQFAANRQWDQYHMFLEYFAEIQHCYAMTVHRSQGSTFDNVLVDLPDMMKNMNEEELIRLCYVAITRPRFNVLMRL